MKKFLILPLLLLSACAANDNQPVDGEYGSSPAPVAAPATPAPAPSESAQQQMIDKENAYRNSVGQESLMPGLTCNLYTVPSATVSIIGATLTSVGAFSYTGVFNQPNTTNPTGINVLPTALQTVYTQYYILKCSGSLVMPDSGWHSFTVSSDDGANLYIDGGSPLINNDGTHGIQSKSASKLLKYGIHTFELDYYSYNGQQALILQEDGDVMPNSGFFH